MSPFAGYALPGTVFLLFGLKWSVEAACEPNQNNLYENGGNHQTETRLNRSSSRKFYCRLKGWPVEGVVKLSITALGIGASLLTSYPNGKLQNMGDILYATVYLFFATSGLVDVLVYSCPHTMPHGVDKVTLALGFIIEGLMFQLHLVHRPFMEQHVHILLVYIIFSTVVVCLVEVVVPFSLPKLIRGFLTLVHGSWYIQSGFILHSPIESTSSWSSNTDYNNALVGISLTFAWHCATIFVILLILLVIVRRKRGSSSNTPIPSFDTELAVSLPECNSCSNGRHSKI